ncbi:hypothetical protein EOM39_07955, partial [Candidatus Gracilibacteria bacterium]|nr:hypothetical protein [Candidatus Gracilibacteria bacterium]
TKAVDYSKRYPTVIGKKLGILTESGTNSPIQEVSSIVSSGYLDVVLTTSNFKAILDDNTIISGTGGKLVNGSVSLSVTNKYNNCKEIIEGNLITKYVDGQYYIYLNGNKIQVYCDMTTGSGGRTMIKRWGRLGRNGKIESDRKGVMVASGQIGDLNDLNLLGTKIAKMSDSMINSIKFTEIMFRQESDNAKVFVYTGSISSDKRITASSSFVYKVGLNGTIKTSSLTSAGGGCTKYGIYISEDTGDGIGNTACGGTFIAQDGGYIHTGDNNGFGVNGAYVYTNKTGDQWVR